MLAQKISTNYYITKICCECNKEYFGPANTTYCCDRCEKDANNKRVHERKRLASLEKYPEGSYPNTFVECKICGFRSSDIACHLKIHNISSKEYMEKYNAFTKCENTLDKMRGSNNIAANHGGKLSPYSKKFVKYQNVDNVEEIISNLGKTASETARKNNNLIGSYDYYLSRGYTKEEAFEMKSKKVFSLAKCIEKYGEEEGYNVWCKRQEKWLNSFRKNNYSKISQELFDEIYKHYNQTEIHYATKDKTINKNQEYRLKLSDGTFVLPDFICIDTKKIIEFDGEYWHNENLANPKRRTDRDERIIASGYTIFHVKEYDFKRNREQVIFECLNYLN